MKWTCPICQQENQDKWKCDCGFDESKNYRKYYFITKISDIEIKKHNVQLKEKNMNEVQTKRVESQGFKLDNVKKIYRQIDQYEEVWNRKQATEKINNQREREKIIVEKYEKEAAQGNMMAQNNLAYCYKEGIGVEQNWRLAAYWWKKAGEQGDIKAKCNLAYCYEKGLGVYKDKKMAVKLYRECGEIEKARKLEGFWGKFF